MQNEANKLVVPQWFDEWYKTFNGDKTKALYYLNRVGWGYDLTYDNGYMVEGYADKLHDLLDEDRYEKAQEYLSKAILFGYEVEKEPLYYAKVKRADDLPDRFTYRYFRVYDFELGVSPNLHYKDIAEPLTISQWLSVGINVTNADFEEV